MPPVLSSRPSRSLFSLPAANSYRLQSRVAKASTTTSTTGGTGDVPAWLRLVRVGNTLSASSSPDGMVWTAVGTPVTIATMPATINVGIGVASHTTGAMATGVFSNVTVTKP